MYMYSVCLPHGVTGAANTYCVVVCVCMYICWQDSGTRKAVLLVHYVDLHNEFVLEKRGKHGAKYLELFQTFR